MSVSSSYTSLYFFILTVFFIYLYNEFIFKREQATGGGTWTKTLGTPN